MELILKEIIHLVNDCEENKGMREADRVKQERECYTKIKEVVEPFFPVIKERKVNV